MKKTYIYIVVGLVILYFWHKSENEKRNQQYGGPQNVPLANSYSLIETPLILNSSAF